MDEQTNRKIHAQMILEHLRWASITPLEAQTFFRCWRLAARIFDLRQKGHIIHTTIVKNDNGTHFARYTLLRQAHPEKRDENL